MKVRLSAFTQRRLLRDSRGTNMIEAALVLPMVLFVTFAIVDFASLMYAYTALENGVSLATRYAITGRVSGQASREASIRIRMRQATPTLTIPDNAFTFSHIPVGDTNWLSGVGGPNDIGRVRVDYTWSLMTPLASVLFTDGEFTFAVESVMKNKRFQ